MQMLLAVQVIGANVAAATGQATREQITVGGSSIYNANTAVSEKLNLQIQYSPPVSRDVNDMRGQVQTLWRIGFHDRATTDCAGDCPKVRA